MSTSLKGKQFRYLRHVSLFSLLSWSLPLYLNTGHNQQKCLYFIPISKASHQNEKSQYFADFFAWPLSLLTFCLVNISSGPKFPLGIFGPEMIFTKSATHSWTPKFHPPDNVTKESNLTNDVNWGGPK